MDKDTKLYTPMEVAKILNISTYTLRYLRQTGRIEGTFTGNTTLYTREQIDKAELPRPKRKSKKTPTTQDNDEPSAQALAS